LFNFYAYNKQVSKRAKFNAIIDKDTILDHFSLFQRTVLRGSRLHNPANKNGYYTLY